MLIKEILKTLECASFKSNEFAHITRNPIALSCGHVICKECINNENGEQIVCFSCNLVNYNDLSKSNESLSTKSLFNLFLDQLFVHIEECFKEVISSNNTKDFESEDCIYARIDQVKHEIETRVDNLKAELDDLRQELFKKVDKIKEDFSHTNDLNETRTRKQQEFEEILSVLSENNNNSVRRTESSFFEFQTKLEELHDFTHKLQPQALDLNLTFAQSNLKLDKSIIGNLEYFNTALKSIDSTILSYNELNSLNELCEFSSLSKWTLVYRGSQHGFAANDFHKHCDGISNTLVIVQSTNENVFGGYVSETWCNIGGYKRDPTSFIFSFKNKHEKQVKFSVLRPENAIYCRCDNGPIFGCNDFYIDDNCNQVQTSGSCFPIAYTSQSGIKRDDYYLAGEKNFLVKEIEVFKIIE